MTKNTLKENLRRLQTHLGSRCQEYHFAATENEADARKVSVTFPLAHGRSRHSFKMVCEDRFLRSLESLCQVGVLQVQEKDCEEAVEVKLGTWDSVFFYASNFCYPSTECGFLFKTELEVAEANENRATPFDSGGLIYHLLKSSSLAEQRAFLSRSELPIPQYRELLGSFLLQGFDQPRDYLMGTGPRFEWFDFEDGDRRKWTFEVRLKGEVKVTEHLLAVFLPETLLLTSPVVKNIVPLWREQGVAIQTLGAPTEGRFDLLQSEAAQFLQTYFDGPPGSGGTLGMEG